MPVCLNCGAFITGNFCSKCGQKKDVGRLSWRSLGAELIHFFTHLEKGFLYTSWRLAIRPDTVILEYLKGKRKKYFKPVSLYLIWVAIHLLAYKFIIDWMQYENLRTGSFLLRGGETQTFIVKHSNFFGLFLMPILSIFMWLLVSRPRLNYIESLTVVIYAFAAVEMLIFLQIVITGLFFRTNFLTDHFLIQVQVVSYVWNLYAVFMLFRGDKIKFLIPRILLALMIGILVNIKTTQLIAQFFLGMKK